jgi:hypothetical protein
MGVLTLRDLDIGWHFVRSRIGLAVSTPHAGCLPVSGENVYEVVDPS